MSDACCCIDVDDGGPEEWSYSQTEPTARKEHRCGECNGTIKPGQRYRRESGMWNDSWSTHITCMVCAAVRDDRMSCGWIYGQVWDDIAACLWEFGCRDLSWLHPMFEDSGNDCECEECLPQ